MFLAMARIRGAVAFIPSHRPIRRRFSIMQAERAKKTQAQELSMLPLADDFFSSHKERISPHTLRALTEGMGLERMTEIQAKSLPVALSGVDVLARARTGTGKTVAFLTPALQLVKPRKSGKASGIDILVVSPTRELATQIAATAEAMTEFHPGARVQVVFGGTNAKTDVRRFDSALPSVLVATPGRLLDHLQNTRLAGGRGSFSDALGGLKVLVLDEADQLMDQGFAKDILRIISYLPRERQTFLFSATMPPALRPVMSKALNSDYVTVDCIGDDGPGAGEVSPETSRLVTQTFAVVPSMDRFVSSVLETALAALEEGGPDAKVIVFFSTASLTAFMAAVARESGLPGKVLEIHSRLSQPKRDKAADAFRTARSGEPAVLFTSNVSARGVDYPDVTHVLQVLLGTNSNSS